MENSPQNIRGYTDNFTVYIASQCWKHAMRRGRCFGCWVRSVMLNVSVVLAQHSELGLEARRRRRVPGRAETWLHRPKLPCSRLFHSDGQPLHHEVVQSGTYHCWSQQFALWSALLLHVYCPQFCFVFSLNELRIHVACWVMHAPTQNSFYFLILLRREERY